MVIGNHEAARAAKDGGTPKIDVFRLAARWRQGPEWEKMEGELDWEPEPSHLNTINSSGLFHAVSQDKMSVTYVGSPQHGHDVGAVQSDCQAPSRRVAYYFEMEVKNAGQKGQVAIGFTQQQFKMRRQPGWEANSCGYHGDDGFVYRGHGKGEPFGPTFTTGDIIGSGINYAAQEFFFTKNGVLIGTVCKDIKGPLYPTVAVHSQNEEVTVNFGKQPFLFNIEVFVLEERFKLQNMIEKITLPGAVTHRIVRSYLLHYGYQDTLNAFDIAIENSCQPELTVQENGFVEQKDTYALSHRKVLRQLILGGDIDAANEKLRVWYPQLFQDDKSAICFLLHSQRFIEYIRASQLEVAVDYARIELAKFFIMKPSPYPLEVPPCSFMMINTCHSQGLLDQVKPQDVIALLAYYEPSKSCVGYLLGATQREFVADAVNAAVLSTNSAIKDPTSCIQSCLEKVLRQLTLCCMERRALNGDQGADFYLHRELGHDSSGLRR